MKKPAWVVLAILLFAVSVACGRTLISYPALIIELRDARTGAFVAGTTVVVEDRGFREVYSGASTQHGGLGAASDRAGTYDVTVTHPDYQEWHRSGIRVPWTNRRNPFDGSRVPLQTWVVVQLEPLERP